MAEDTANKPEATKQPETNKDLDAAIARAKAAEEKAAKLEAADKERKDKETSSKKKAEEEDAKKRGEFDSLMKQREAELEAAKKQATELEAATKKRIDAMIEKLPESSKKKIDKIKDDLSLVKLEEFVAAEAETASETSVNAPPSMTPGSNKSNNGKRKLQPKTYDILEKLNVDPASGEGLELLQDDATGKWKFRLPIKTMLSRLNALRVNPDRLDQENLRKRSGHR